MSGTGDSKRHRKVINYALMDSLDISDEDEFSGFSSPVTRPPHHKPSKSSSKNEKSKLQKKRKLSKQRDEADSEGTATSEAEDSDTTSARSAPRPRPALHEKLFQRDLEAALELSRQCAGVAAPENKENVPDSSYSPPRPLRSPPATAITPVVVPVEVHQPRTPPAPPSLVCRQGNTHVPILPEPTPRGGVSEQIVSEDTPATAAKGAQGDSEILVNGSKKHVKRKACVIESDDDDDFNAPTPPKGVTSTRVEEIERKEPAKTSPDCLLTNTSEVETVTKSAKHHAASRDVDSNTDSAMKRGQIVTPRSEADLANSGRGKRARRAVSFLPEPNSDSEAEWAEPDELDEDDMSASEGSDFEPSPKKNNKKITPASKTRNTAAKTAKNNKPCRGTIKQSTATLTNSKRSGDCSGLNSATDGISPLTRTANTATPTGLVSKTSLPASLVSKAPKPTQPKLAPVPSRDRASSSLTVAPLVRGGATSASPRAGLARAAFKCPVMGAAANGASPANRGPATSVQTGTLRLGLSRKSSFKPLHPNAAVK